MIAYNVKTFYVCRITSAVYCEILYTLNKVNEAYTKHFSCEESAAAYIRKEKKDMLLNVLEKYIHHKRHIIESNNDASKKASLTICFQALEKYQGIMLIDICKGIIKGKKHFENILPAPANASYQNSSDTLTAILQFCAEQIK